MLLPIRRLYQTAAAARTSYVRPTTRDIHRQQGLTLLTVVTLIAILIASVLFFLSAKSTRSQIAGNIADIDDARRLAENAANTLYGQFVYNADLNADGAVDITQLQTVTANATLTPPLSYAFFVTAGKGLDQTAPSLLQRIANGEAYNKSGAVTGQIVAVSVTQAKVGDLFGATYRPFLYVQGGDGAISTSVSGWDAETAARKAAAWIELTKDPDTPNKINVFVAAAARIGNVKGYVQKYIGSYAMTLGGLSPLMQSN